MDGSEPLEVLIVEDEILLATELGFLVQESGCRDVGHAMSSDEAVELAASLRRRRRDPRPAFDAGACLRGGVAPTRRRHRKAPAVPIQ